MASGGRTEAFTFLHRIPGSHGNSLSGLKAIFGVRLQASYPPPPEVSSHGCFQAVPWPDLTPCPPVPRMACTVLLPAPRVQPLGHSRPSQAALALPQPPSAQPCAGCGQQAFPSSLNAGPAACLPSSHIRAHTSLHWYTCHPHTCKHCPTHAHHLTQSSHTCEHHRHICHQHTCTRSSHTHTHAPNTCSYSILHTISHTCTYFCMCGEKSTFTEHDAETWMLLAASPGIVSWSPHGNPAICALLFPALQMRKTKSCEVEYPKLANAGTSMNTRTRADLQHTHAR